MPKAGRITRERFSLHAKPLFRACEVVCNHAARIILRKDRLAVPELRAQLAALDGRRADCQRVLNDLLASHGRVCADCGGHCCGGGRERDAFIDRILQDPETLHVRARRRTGQMPAYAAAEKRGEPIRNPDGAEGVAGFCPELTTKGCRIPYELRPVQCTAYFCRSAVKELSPEECARGIEALKGLMRVQLGVVRLALRSRFRS